MFLGILQFSLNLEEIIRIEPIVCSYYILFNNLSYEVNWAVLGAISLVLKVKSYRIVVIKLSSRKPNQTTHSYIKLLKIFSKYGVIQNMGSGLHSSLSQFFLYILYFSLKLIIFKYFCSINTLLWDLLWNQRCSAV